MQNVLQWLLGKLALVLPAWAPILSLAIALLQCPFPPILRVSTSKLIMFLINQVPLLTNDEKWASTIVGCASFGVFHVGATHSCPPPSDPLKIPLLHPPWACHHQNHCWCHASDSTICIQRKICFNVMLPPMVMLEPLKNGWGTATGHHNNHNQLCKNEIWTWNRPCHCH